MAKDLSFSQALKKLEENVEKLESSDLDLEEGLKLLSEGLKLHKYCEDKLKNAQVKIDKVTAESGVS